MNALDNILVKDEFRPNRYKRKEIKVLALQMKELNKSYIVSAMKFIYKRRELDQFFGESEKFVEEHITRVIDNGGLIIKTNNGDKKAGKDCFIIKIDENTKDERLEVLEEKEFNELYESTWASGRWSIYSQNEIYKTLTRMLEAYTDNQRSVSIDAGDNLVSLSDTADEVTPESFGEFMNVSTRDSTIN